tara:strand:- start:839 stop:1786 length:948 start_codon:yes stop_codon:yes gene_type:complete
MRQAGRYLPEFRKIRSVNKDFIKLCLNPDLVKEITLQPINRFKLDAAIIFSDILIIPYGLNQKVEFKKGYGPILGEIDFDKIINFEEKDFIDRVSPVYAGIKKTKENLKNTNLIGFAGAPWTLLVYMINKESPKKSFNVENFFKEEKIEKLMHKIEDFIYLHLKKQIESGADIVQIFDSWAGLIPESKIKNFCFDPTKRIVERLKKLDRPVICFPRGIKEKYEEFCKTVKPDCISIDYDVEPSWILKKAGGIPIQGGLDPKFLLGSVEDLQKNITKYISTFSNYPYIFNLGHGVLPETKPETIDFIVKFIRRKND